MLSRVRSVDKQTGREMQIREGHYTGLCAAIVSAENVRLVPAKVVESSLVLMIMANDECAFRSAFRVLKVLFLLVCNLEMIIFASES